MKSHELQLLIDNPPQKSPYFLLPSIHNIIVDPEIPVKPKRKRKTALNTVTTLWRPANKMTEQNKVQFLTNLLQYATIDFSDMAREHGIASGSQIKRRLNTIIQKEGYKLDGDQIVIDSTAANNRVGANGEHATGSDADPSLQTTSDGDGNAATSGTVGTSAKQTRKRARGTGNKPRELLRKKQKKAVEQRSKKTSSANTQD